MIGCGDNVIRLGGEGRRQSLYFAFSFRYQIVDQSQTLLLWLCVALALFVQTLQAAFKLFGIQQASMYPAPDKRVSDIGAHTWLTA